MRSFSDLTFKEFSFESERKGKGEMTRLGTLASRRKLEILLPGRARYSAVQSCKGVMI